MKRMMTIIAMGVMCMCVTSCTDKYEEAYMAEQMYKYHKSLCSPSSIRYEGEFMELYTSMTDEERTRYKSYREHMDTEARELRTIEERIKAEAQAMLNE